MNKETRIVICDTSERYCEVVFNNGTMSIYADRVSTFPYFVVKCSNKIFQFSYNRTEHRDGHLVEIKMLTSDDGKRTLSIYKKQIKINNFINKESSDLEPAKIFDNCSNEERENLTLFFSTLAQSMQ